MIFMVTMNFPNNRGENLIHQIIAEHPAEDCAEFLEVICEDPFVLVRQLFFDYDRFTGKRVWMDRGDMILNCSRIGKVMPHYAPHPTPGPKEGEGE